MTVTLRLGNRSPSLFDTIRQGGVAADLTSATGKLQARFRDSTTLKIDTAVAIVSASTTLSGDHVLPEPSITVASSSGFLSAGALNVGSQIVEYDAISGNTFLGCRGGDGTIASGATVSQRGGVRYDWAAADVDTAGDLDAWFEITYSGGKVQETPSFDVVITDPGVVFRGICELADVVAYAPGYRSDARTDDLLERLIMAETRTIERETRREFVSIFPVANTRRFDIDGTAVMARTVYVGDMAAAPSSVKVIDRDQATESETVTSANYVLMPRVRYPHESIREIHFPAYSPGAATLEAGRVLEVTSTWGFPSVPEDIREACAKLVIARYVRDAANAGTLLSESLAEINVGALFAAGRAVVRGYGELPLAS